MLEKTKTEVERIGRGKPHKNWLRKKNVISSLIHCIYQLCFNQLLCALVNRLSFIRTTFTQIGLILAIALSLTLTLGI